MAALLQLPWEMSRRAMAWAGEVMGLDGGPPAPPAAWNDPVAWALGGAEAAAWAGQGLLPAPAARELRNKLHAFRTFRHAEEVTGAAALPLPEALGRAGRRDPFTALWLCEGLGYAAAERVRRSGGALGALLQGEEDAGLPASALLPLHTGMGLSLAEQGLREAGDGREPDGRKLAAAVDRFAELCRAGARPGWDAAAFEALGLVGRLLHPQRLPALDRQLAERGDELRALFWHGVGRGLYFAPSQALPWGSPGERALAKARSEPPHPLGRANAVAGVAWALALVNLRHPQVLAAAAGEGGGSLDAELAAAFAHGVWAASRLWLLSTRHRETLTAVTRHRPAAQPAHWDRLVRRPVAKALGGTLEVAEEGAIPRLFRLLPAEEEAP